MSRSLITFALATALLASQPGFAEIAPRTMSLAPAGQGPGVHGSSMVDRSNKSRSSVKAKTRADEAASSLAPAG